MTPIVWTYWEGEMPAYIRVCLDSIARHCGDTHRHVTPENLRDYLPEVDKQLVDERVSRPAVRCDYIRVNLMAKYGGFYCDADTVMLKRPDSVFTDEDLLHVVWPTGKRRVPNGYVYCREGSPLAAEWLEMARAKLIEGVECWTGLGERMLTPLVDSGKYKTREVPLATFLPLDVDSNIRSFFTAKDWQSLVGPETVCFGMNHSWMWKNRQTDCEAGPSTMRRGRMMFHRLMHHAIQEGKDAAAIG